MSFSQLNTALLNQLNRLDNPELSGETLQDEINRADAINNVATKMIDLGDLQLRAAKLRSEYGSNVFEGTILAIEDKSGAGK